MATIKKKIKGSTIIEVLLASIIIIISFYFGVSILINLQKSNLLYQKVKANILIFNEIASIETNTITTNEKVEINDIWLEKEIEKKASLTYIKITALNKSGDILISQSKIINHEN